MKHPAANQKKCFVIMPFGEKKDAAGKVIDFDEVYDYLIKPTVEAEGIECVRCDKIAESGWIHAKMFEHIYASDIAVVDITSLNPNVFYELGVRHALNQSVTVLLRRKGTAIPFNIQGFQVIEYDTTKLASVDETKKKIAEFIRNGLKSKKNDSPVHEVLDLKIGNAPKPLTKTEFINFQLRKDKSKKIGLVTGDIRHVKGIDVWVNSENTNMQMARFYDGSISGVIRFCGAKRQGGRIIGDTIADELTKIVGEDANVPQGDVYATGAGELEQSNRVKKIFHAASVVGQVGKGYTPIADIAMCVRNALELADSAEFESANLKSILFPLMGTGTGKGDPKQKASELLNAAISHLERHPPCKIDQVYFLVWNEKDLEVCQGILQDAPELISE